MKTFSLKSAEVDHIWVEFDAGEVPLGRLASVIANRLTGKYKPTYTPHIDDGDYVVVVNASNLVTTGNKAANKMYYRHSGFPGGLKERTLESLQRDNPEKIIEKAVSGMIPRNKLHAERMKRLRIFAGTEHSHAPQKPKQISLKETK